MISTQPPQPFAQHDPSTTCASPTTASSLALTTASQSSTCPWTHHIVTGTFNSPSLFVLTYDVVQSTLSIAHTIAAHGPHQYLALGVSSTGRQTVYATTWAAESTLSAWHVGDDYGLTYGNSKAITATGSYVHVQPPPYWTLSGPGFGSQAGVARWLGSAGGPTGELHRLNRETGLIEERSKELIFLAGGADELVGADKTRKALRYGAHSFDCSPSHAGQGQVAYVADLGANAIQAYAFPELHHLYTIPSKQPDDGPRHSIPHPHHPLVFTVTEHSNYIDVYRVPAYGTSGTPLHVARADLLPPNTTRSAYRGDTLRFSSNLDFLYASTRGKNPSTPGLIIAYSLHISPSHIHLVHVASFQTRTSGGKANAIELSPSPIKHAHDLLVLTDDQQGFIDILSFNLISHQFAIEASTQLPPLQHQPQGASHAIWLL